MLAKPNLHLTECNMVVPLVIMCWQYQVLFELQKDEI